MSKSPLSPKGGASAKPRSDLGPDQEQPFISHLIELRERLLRMVFAVLAVFLCLFWFANDIYTLLAAPLLRYLPEGTSMIATEVASPFLTPFKLSLVLSVFIAIPYILYQAWAFVAPGLYRHEQRLVLPLVVSSTLLYFLGMAFAYFVVFPLMFRFFVSVAPEGVAVMTDITKYLDFVLKLFFAFGVAFEVPVATVLLVITGVTTPEALAEKRPYIIVGVFVVAMLLTPPDVISQTLLALPVWALFELGIYMSRLIARQRAREAGEGDGPPRPPPPKPPGDGGGGGTDVAAAGAGGAAGMAIGGAGNETALSTGAKSLGSEANGLFDDGEDDGFEDGFDDEDDAADAADLGPEQPDVTHPAEPREVPDPDRPRFVSDGWEDEMAAQSGAPESAATEGPTGAERQ